MISDYDYYRNRPELKPAIDCFDILTGLCGIIPVDYVMRTMNEKFDPTATAAQVYEFISKCPHSFGQDFGIWTHLSIDYFTHGSLTAASCETAEFYRAKHQIYTYDEELGEYVGEYGPPNYKRADTERIKYMKHHVSAHDGIEPPTDLSEYLEIGVESALFDRPVAQELHKVARAKRRDKTTSFLAEQAIRRNIRHIIGCDGTSDVWIPLLTDSIVASTSLSLRNKLDIPKIEQLTLKMFQTFPKWENNGWSDDQIMNRGRRNVHVEIDRKVNDRKAVHAIGVNVPPSPVHHHANR